MIILSSDIQYARKFETKEPSRQKRLVNEACSPCKILSSAGNENTVFFSMTDLLSKFNTSLTVRAEMQVFQISTVHFKAKGQSNKDKPSHFISLSKRCRNTPRLKSEMPASSPTVTRSPRFITRQINTALD